MSTSPGMMVWPAASMTSAPAGIPVVARGPAATMRSSRMTIPESGIGSPPVPSMSWAPTMARPPGSAGGGGLPAQAARAATATRTARRSRIRAMLAGIVARRRRGLRDDDFGVLQPQVPSVLVAFRAAERSAAQEIGQGLVPHALQAGGLVRVRISNTVEENHETARISTIDEICRHAPTARSTALAQRPREARSLRLTAVEPQSYR